MAWFSKRERRAYHMGRAYAAGKKGVKVKGLSENEKRSFANGFNKVVNFFKRKGKK